MRKYLQTKDYSYKYKPKKVSEIALKFPISNQASKFKAGSNFINF